MTIATETRQVGPFVGDGVTIQFTFSFKVFAATDVKVLSQVIATLVSTELVYGTGFSVQMNADQDLNPGGTIRYQVASVDTALPATLQLYIIGNTPRTQTADLITGGSWLPGAIENALDRCIAVAQQIFSLANRAIRQPTTDATAIGELPVAATRANQYLVFDASGNPSVSAGSGTDTGLRADLADQVDTAKGAGLVGVAAGTNLTAGTVRAKLLEIVADLWVTTIRIAANAVTLAKMQQIATNSLLGRSTAATGNVEVITVGSGLLLATGTLSATGLAVATQAEQEAASSTAVATTPGRQQYHPSAAKAWVNFESIGTLAIEASYNVSSVTDNAVGDFTVNFTTAFSSVHYAMAGSAKDGGGSLQTVVLMEKASVAPTTTTMRIIVVLNDATTNALIDSDANHCVFYGDQ